MHTQHVILHSGHKLTYSMSRIFLEKLIDTQLVKKFPSMEPKGSLACSQRVHHQSLSWDILIKSTTLHPVCSSSIPVLPSHLQMWSLPSRLSGQNFLCIFLSPMHATFPIHLILNFVTLVIFEVYKLWISSLCSLVQPLFILSIVNLNILITPTIFFLPLV